MMNSTPKLPHQLMIRFLWNSYLDMPSQSYQYLISDIDTSRKWLVFINDEPVKSADNSMVNVCSSLKAACQNLFA